MRRLSGTSMRRCARRPRPRRRPSPRRHVASSPLAVVLLCGFSDGTITSWTRTASQWKERPLVHVDLISQDRFDSGELDRGMITRSVTDIDGRVKADGTLVVVISNSGGASCLEFPVDEEAAFTYQMLVKTSSSAIKIVEMEDDANADAANCGATSLIVVGTAAPKHNKIHIFTLSMTATTTATTAAKSHYCGALMGHEDWVSCFAWTRVATASNAFHMLASGSQDARIRLWKFSTATTTATTTMSGDDAEYEEEEEPVGDDVGDDDSADDNDDEEEEEGESRLEIYHNNGNTSKVTSITLEALLIAHEERIASVNFHPDPQSIYGQDMIIVSSSMDRAIFIWSQDDESGVWTPISRVGSAGGILGGPIGSSLLGFINTQIEPKYGRWILGHSYGGAMHFFSCHTDRSNVRDDGDEKEQKTDEEEPIHVTWNAEPCITGHFDGVNDVCWEAVYGRYLLTASADHTCRIWAPVPSMPSTVASSDSEDDVWIELARPQVHGYHLSAISSISCESHPHLIASGADEKELRAFDATRSFLSLFHSLSNAPSIIDDNIERVERAYVPSLGLSNKANAADAAEEDTTMGLSVSAGKLPLERDLGAVSLWPEAQKLYGHDTELFRLTSTVSARTGPQYKDSPYANDLLVASSAKARDVEAACIRLWNVEANICVQVLKGGHKSTVAALSFSPDGKYLASSGKDRRLCIWRRAAQDNEPFVLASAMDSAHKRIVWSVHFCPFDPTIVTSASRDGSVKVWRLVERSVDASIEVEMKKIGEFHPMEKLPNGKPQSVTSVSFAPASLSGGHAVLALGLESGMIELWSVGFLQQDDEAATITLMQCLPPEQCHISTVTKMAWRPMSTAAGNDAQPLYLATGSSDHGCRIFKVQRS